MTKEEAKKILSGYVKACNEDDFPTLEMFEYEKVLEAMTMGAKALSIPSLPSNLDEAAEKYANRGISSNADPYEEIIAYRAAKDAFKACAEWLTEQGWTLEGEVKDYPTGGGDFEIYLDYNRDEMDAILDEICDYVNEKYPNDDNRYKVIIQIRKKNNPAKA